jgi:hypothetical protein
MAWNSNTLPQTKPTLVDGFCHECEFAGMLQMALLPLALPLYEHRPFHWLRIDAKPPGE